MRPILGTVLVTAALALTASCDRPRGRDRAQTTTVSAAEAAAPARATDDARFASARTRLLEIVRSYGVTDSHVLAAVGKVPRHELVPEPIRGSAYDDRALPIGQEQTISQPSLVARMTELARVDPGDRVLEIGTGSGYQAAILAELGSELYTIEIVPSLAKRARGDLERLGYGGRIQFRIGDGYAGWPEAAPFDAIIVTAAPPEIPAPLKQQLKVGGRLVIPVGTDEQDLRVIERTKDGFIEHPSIPVHFVPMTGRAQER